ncbi:MAG: diguanylate cyclase [Candidatus Cloacimonetes bacterium]|nr:diguanylate cyclase [Candidatus Cloacimonadota bacterium]
MISLSRCDIYQKIFDSALVAIGVTDPSGKFILVNRAWSEYMGYSAEESKDLDIDAITPPCDRRTSSKNYSKIIKSKTKSFRKLRSYLRKDGSQFWADLFVSPIVDNDGSVTGVLGIFINIDQMVQANEKSKSLNEKLEALNQEITAANIEINLKNQELKKAYLELENIATTDMLTGMNNRRILNDVLMKELNRSKRTNRSVAIGIADLDGFKKINDTYGHDCGDEVLKVVAKILTQSIRLTDTVGRWGGEEFLFVFPETDCTGASIVFERIRKAVETHHFVYKGSKIPITITIGFSYHLDNFEESLMLDEADKALYQGKRNGKNQVVCYGDVCSHPVQA